MSNSETKQDHKEKPVIEPSTAVAGCAFGDPREKSDRRQDVEPQDIPTEGCRRQGSRRKTTYIDKDQWWLQRSYAAADDSDA